MFILVTVLIMIAALVLALIVLVQNGKGGGLAANFASQNQVMGVRKTTDFLEKATWFLAGAMIVFCLLSSALIPKPRQTNQTLNSSNVPSVPATNSNSNAQGSNTAQPLNQ
ncbi:MAG: preprotein translocase subunit SecG [Synergistales bacterium]|nr:preprotein translocase subunit SecG [Bacteroidales bacterium]MDY6402541.1 preprotein translocase subunit SecG [Bacteroidales bacterium]MDY6424065.1 preprotein translocase subunit SecG [Bacteroidales bacterium]MDY6435091.1 preprotein translocase subunit SecG [Synergistales bacterium]